MHISTVFILLKLVTPPKTWSDFWFQIFFLHKELSALRKASQWHCVLPSNPYVEVLSLSISMGI